MSEPVKIAIVLEGGCLSAVLTAGVPVEYVLIDYDVEGSDSDQIRMIPQDRAKPAPAFVHVDMADPRGPFVLEAFALANPDPAQEGPPPEREWVTNPSAGISCLEGGECIRNDSGRCRFCGRPMDKEG